MGLFAFCTIQGVKVKMSRVPETPRYMIYIGEREQVEGDCQWIGMYAVNGFSGEDSRFDQVMEVVNELSVEADTLEVRPIFSKEEVYLRRVAGRPRIPLPNGLVAEVIAQQTADGWKSTYNAEPTSHPPAQPFPWVHSIVG